MTLNVTNRMRLVGAVGVLALTIGADALAADARGIVCDRRAIVAGTDGAIPPATCSLIGRREATGSLRLASSDCPESISFVASSSAPSATVSGALSGDVSLCSVVMESTTDASDQISIKIFGIGAVTAVKAPSAVSAFETSKVQFAASVVGATNGIRGVTIPGATWSCTASSSRGVTGSCSSFGAEISAAGAFAWTPNGQAEGDWTFVISAKFTGSAPLSKDVLVRVKDLDPPPYLYLNLPQPGRRVPTTTAAKQKWPVSGICSKPGATVVISGLVAAETPCRPDGSFGAMLDISAAPTSAPLLVSLTSGPYTAVAVYRDIFAPAPRPETALTRPAPTITIEGGAPAHVGDTVACSAPWATSNLDFNHLYYVMEWTGGSAPARKSLTSAQAPSGRYRVEVADLGGSIGCRYTVAKSFDPSLLKNRDVAASNLSPEALAISDLPQEVQVVVEQTAGDSKDSIDSNSSLTEEEKNDLKSQIDQTIIAVIQTQNPAIITPTVGLVQDAANCQTCTGDDQATILTHISDLISVHKQNDPPETTTDTTEKIQNTVGKIISLTEKTNTDSANHPENAANNNETKQHVNDIVDEVNRSQDNASNATPSTSTPASTPLDAASAVVGAVEQNYSYPPAFVTPGPDATPVANNPPTAEENQDPCYYEANCWDECVGPKRYGKCKTFCDPTPPRIIACRARQAMSSAADSIAEAAATVGEDSVAAREAAQESWSAIEDTATHVVAVAGDPSTPEAIRSAATSASSNAYKALGTAGSSKNKKKVSSKIKSANGKVSQVLADADNNLRDEAPYIIAEPYKLISNTARKTGPELAAAADRVWAATDRMLSDTFAKVDACIEDESKCIPRPTEMIEAINNGVEDFGDLAFDAYVDVSEALADFDEARVAFMEVMAEALDAAIDDATERMIWEAIVDSSHQFGGAIMTAWKDAYEYVASNFPAVEEYLAATWRHILEMTPGLRNKALAGLNFYHERFNDSWFYMQLASLGDDANKDLYDRWWDHWEDMGAHFDEMSLPARQEFADWIEIQGQVTLLNVMNSYVYVKEKGPDWIDATGDFLTTVDPGPALAKGAHALAKLAGEGQDCAAAVIKGEHCTAVDSLFVAYVDAQAALDDFVTMEKLADATVAAVDFTTAIGESVCDPSCQKANLRGTEELAKNARGSVANEWDAALTSAADFYDYLKQGGLQDEWGNLSNAASLVYNKAYSPELQKQHFQHWKDMAENFPTEAKEFSGDLVDWYHSILPKCDDDTDTSAIECASDPWEKTFADEAKRFGGKVALAYHDAVGDPDAGAAAEDFRAGMSNLVENGKKAWVSAAECSAGYLNCTSLDKNREEAHVCLKALEASDQCDAVEGGSGSSVEISIVQ